MRIRAPDDFIPREPLLADPSQSAERREKVLSVERVVDDAGEVERAIRKRHVDLFVDALQVESVRHHAVFGETTQEALVGETLEVGVIDADAARR